MTLQEWRRSQDAGSLKGHKKLYKVIPKTVFLTRIAKTSRVGGGGLREAHWKTANVTANALGSTKEP